MKIVMFYHTVVSDWNNGNAHFLRGIVTELMSRGHDVEVYEPASGWSLTHLLKEEGEAAVNDFHAAYPGIRSVPYEIARIDLDRVLERADLVLVHEWNDPDLVRSIGERRRASRSFRLLFHDTHHRSVSDQTAISEY
jgi:spore maturation protein CgeB